MRQVVNTELRHHIPSRQNTATTKRYSPPDGIRWLRRYLRDFAESGGTVLISSHQLAELEQVVDEVVVIKRRALFAGKLGDLVSREGDSLENKYFDLVEEGVA
nr:hypothetical protein BJQ95_02417 [Cryobacterium sp. SO1]